MHCDWVQVGTEPIHSEHNELDFHVMRLLIEIFDCEFIAWNLYDSPHTLIETVDIASHIVCVCACISFVEK